MPQAIGPAVGAIAGYAAGAAYAGSMVYSGAMTAISIGMTVGSLVQKEFFTDMPSMDASFNAASLSKPDINVSPSDSAMGFLPIPNMGTSAAAIPLVFGNARFAPNILDYMAYAENYKKVYMILGCCESGPSLNNLWVDDWSIEKLPNYGTTDEDTWYKFSADGAEEFAYSISNSGVLRLGRVHFFRMFSRDLKPFYMAAAQSSLLHRMYGRQRDHIRNGY